MSVLGKRECDERETRDKKTREDAIEQIRILESEIKKIQEKIKDLDKELEVMKNKELQDEGYLDDFEKIKDRKKGLCKELDEKNKRLQTKQFIAYERD